MLTPRLQPPGSPSPWDKKGAGGLGARREEKEGEGAELWPEPSSALGAHSRDTPHPGDIPCQGLSLWQNRFTLGWT